MKLSWQQWFLREMAGLAQCSIAHIQGKLPGICTQLLDSVVCCQMMLHCGISVVTLCAWMVV